MRIMSLCLSLFNILRDYGAVDKVEIRWERRRR
jgi:hypothetical protein